MAVACSEFQSKLYKSDFKESEKSCKASGASVKHSEPAAAAVNYFNTQAC